MYTSAKGCEGHVCLFLPDLEQETDFQTTRLASELLVSLLSVVKNRSSESALEFRARQSSCRIFGRTAC